MRIIDGLYESAATGSEVRFEEQIFAEEAVG
jgi:hypothetical protein